MKGPTIKYIDSLPPKTRKPKKLNWKEIEEVTKKLKQILEKELEYVKKTQQVGSVYGI